MRTSPILAGLAVGAVLGLGGVVAADVASPDAQAQQADPATGQDPSKLTKGDVVGIDRRARAAIRRATNLSNRLGKYVNPDGVVIGYQGDPILQQKGLGTGLPNGVIADGAISESKLDGALRTKVNTDTTKFVYRTDTITLPGGASAGPKTVSCQAGEVAVGGGWKPDADADKAFASESYPAADMTGWTVRLGTTGAGGNFTIYAVCSSNG